MAGRKISRFYFIYNDYFMIIFMFEFYNFEAWNLMKL